MHAVRLAWARSINACETDLDTDRALGDRLVYGMAGTEASGPAQ